MMNSDGAWHFSSALKVATERVVPADETLRKLHTICAGIPVTRIANLTPLDPLRLPAYSVVTPMARDLTTHMGKGQDETAAKVSALMEAVERISAETSVVPAICSSFLDLATGDGIQPVDPRTLELPPDSGFRETHAYSWYPAYDVSNGIPVLLPADLVLTPPSEGILTEVDTNGLASGNTRLEAIVHATCEVIERDARGQLEFAERYGDGYDYRVIDQDTLPDSIAKWVFRLAEGGLTVSLYDITSNVGVATIQALLVDARYPTDDGVQCARFGGWGTHPDACVAALRAITEAIQSRLGFIQGARDTFNITLARRRVALPGSGPRLARQLAPIPFSQIPSFRTDDLLEDFHFIVRALRSAGFAQVFCADLTRPDLEFPVLRVRIPGLTSFAVNRRRIGWRCLRYLL